MPADERYEWFVDIVDYNPYCDSEPLLPQATPFRLNPEQKALVAVREAEKDTYETTVKTSVWVSRGKLKIDVCTEKEKKENQCDNTYSLKWYTGPKSCRSGPGFLLADVMKGSNTRKQIILRVARVFRRKAGNSAPAP